MQQRIATLVLAAAVLVSCDNGGGTGPTPVPTPAQIQAVGGEGQTGTVGTQLPTSIAVRVTGASGAPIAQQLVIFRVISGGGSVGSGVVRTGADGQASDRWTLGPSAGVQRLEVRVENDAGGVLAADSVTATALAAAPAQLLKLSGDGQSGTPGDTLPAPLAVRVRDTFGNPVGGSPCSGR